MKWTLNELDGCFCVYVCLWILFYQMWIDSFESIELAQWAKPFNFEMKFSRKLFLRIRSWKANFVQ